MGKTIRLQFSNVTVLCGNEVLNILDGFQSSTENSIEGYQGQTTYSPFSYSKYEQNSKCPPPDVYYSTYNEIIIQHLALHLYGNGYHPHFIVNYNFVDNLNERKFSLYILM